MRIRKNMIKKLSRVKIKESKISKKNAPPIL